MWNDGIVVEPVGVDRIERDHELSLDMVALWLRRVWAQVEDGSDAEQFCRRRRRRLVMMREVEMD